VIVVDPWNASRRERLRVASKNTLDIKAIPAQLAITAESDNKAK